MLPDLRFILGAALGTIVLSLTAFGLASSVRLAHEARMHGPLDGSRPLAFTTSYESGVRSAWRAGEAIHEPGDPFAGIPLGGSTIAQAPQEPDSAATPPSADAASAEPNEPTEATDSHANVDERAVVDPPLSPTGEPEPETDAAPPGAPASAEEPPARAEEPAAETTGSVPAVAEDQGELVPMPPERAKAAPKKAKAKRRAQPKRVIQPTASTGYPVIIPPHTTTTRTNGFPFGD